MKIVVGESSIGLGVFATAPISKDEIVVDWSDNPLFEKPPRIRNSDCWRQIAPGTYVGPLGAEEHPDAYFNHSCRPNSTVRFKRPDIHLVALRDIPAGCEITFDYSEIYEAPWKMVCRCGAPECRKIILGRNSS